MTAKIHDSHRGRSGNFSAAMRRSAEARRCPHCARKSALSRVETEFVTANVCRWCGYARGRDLSTGDRFEEIPKVAAMRER